MLLTLLACSGGEDTAEANSGELPDFNYIPMNTDACNPDEDELEEVTAVLESVLEHDNYAVEGMELCSTEMVSSCPACGDGENALLSALDAVWYDDAGTELTEYFRAALAYPYRFAVVSLDADADSGPVTVSQASGLDCALDDTTQHITCGTYTLTPQSLNATCTQPALSFAGATTSSGATTTVQTNVPTDGSTFGFYVPLMDELPDPASFETDEEMQTWVRRQPNVPVLLEYPSLDLTLNQDGTGCGRLTGYVRADILAYLAEDPSTLSPFLFDDPSGKVPDGYIQTVIALDLDGNDTFASGSDQ
jgi:hypothetical protein